MTDSTHWPAPPQEALSGAEVRRLTRQATEAHGGGRVSELIGEVYSILVALGIAWLVVIGAVQALGIHTGGQWSQSRVDPGWLGLGALVLGLGVILSLFARLGPMGTSAGHAAWWLPMPADRTGLLRPRLVAVTALALVVGGGLGAAAGAAMVADVGLGRSLTWSMLAAALAAAVAALMCVAGQIRLGVGKHRRTRPLVLVGEGMVVAGPLLVLLAALLRPPPLDLIGALIPATAILAVAAVTLGLWCARGLERLAGFELRQRGAVSGHAAGSAQSLDTRELGRALSVPGLPRDRRRSASFSWVSGPTLALVTGDATLTLRNPRHLLQLGVGAAIALVPLVAGWSSGLAVVAYLIGGYVAALATGEGARLAEVAPVLDRSFPLEAVMVRRVRVLWPLLVLSLWNLLVSAGWGWVYGDLGGWLLMGLFAAPSFAAGVLRGAYRKPPDWSQPLLPGPFGPVAPGIITAFSRGPDVVLLCLIPLFVAALATGPTTVLVFVQMAASAVALAIGCHVPAPPQVSPSGRADGG